MITRRVTGPLTLWVVYRNYENMDLLLGNAKIIRSTEEDELGFVKFEEDATKEWRLEWIEKSLFLDVAKLFLTLNRTGGSITVVKRGCICKVNEPGTATCTVCKDALIEYRKAGLNSTTQQLSTKTHVLWLTAVSHCQIYSDVASSSSDDMYGAPSFYCNVTAAPLSTSLKSWPNIRTALKWISTRRTTASYKITYWLSRPFKSMLIWVLQLMPFTLNLDE